jgi:hypothetical protein
MTMNRKPIFDAVRSMLGRGFKTAEIKALDLACDLAEAAIEPGQNEPVKPTPAASDAAPTNPNTSFAKPVPVHRLGSLSETYESGGNGPGTVSSGHGDPGGVSYGTYQLSSNAGTLSAFMKSEGKPWATEFGTAKGGSAEFSAIWKVIAARDKVAFGAAQHDFIERTHYRVAVQAVKDRKGIDLDTRHDAVRDAVWSVAVQHGGAAMILNDSVDATDIKLARDHTGYDRKLVEAIYKRRTDYVLSVASNPKLPANQKQQLISITKNRYPSELKAALAMLDSDPNVKTAPAKTERNTDGTIDGNGIAREYGVDVKLTAKISRLDAKMAPVIPAIAKVAKTLGLPKPVITSGNDSMHMHGSLHFQGRALDFRGNNISVAVGKKFEAETKKALGKDFDVVFETFMNVSNNHLHVEYDPK